MNLTTPDLEDRLRSHYRALADDVPSSFTLDATPFDDVLTGSRDIHLTPVPSRRRWPALAVATMAVAALAVVGLVIAARHTPAETASESVPGQGGLPLLVPGWLPSGFELRGALDQTPPAGPPSRQAIYAESPGTLTGRMLLVSVTSASIETWQGAGVPVTVAGRAGFDLSGDGVAKLVVTNGEGSVALAGRGFSSAELATIAESLGTPSNDVADGPALTTTPAGFTLVSDEAAPSAGRWTDLTYEADGADGADEADGTVRTVAISVYAAPPNGFDQYVVLADPGAPETLDAKRAYRSQGGTDGAWRLAWEESPGVVVEVRAEGVSDVELTRIARDLHAVSDAKWAALLATIGAEPQVGPRPTPTTLGSVTSAPCTAQHPGPPPVTVVVNCSG